MLGEFSEDGRVHQVRVQVVLGRFPAQFVGKLPTQLVEVDRFGAVAGASGLEGGLGFLEALLAQDHFLDRLGKAVLRPTEPATQHVDNTFRKGGGSGFEIHDIRRADAFAEAEERHVAHDLAGGRHLHDVAEELIHLGVGLGDLGPPVRNPHAGGLLFEVRVLAAGHFMDIHLGRAGLRGGVEGCVVFADFLPVVGEAVERLEVELRVARCVLQRGHHRVEVGLRGAAAHGCERQIHHVDPGVARPQNASGVDAAGVMGVEVDGDAHLVLQRLDQLLSGVGSAQAGHVLDGQDVCAHALQFLG